MCVSALALTRRVTIAAERIKHSSARHEMLSCCACRCLGSAGRTHAVVVPFAVVARRAACLAWVVRLVERAVGKARSTVVAVVRVRAVLTACTNHQHFASRKQAHLVCILQDSLRFETPGLGQHYTLGSALPFRCRCRRSGHTAGSRHLRCFGKQQRIVQRDRRKAEGYSQRNTNAVLSQKRIGHSGSC